MASRVEDYNRAVDKCRRASQAEAVRGGTLASPFGVKVLECLVLYQLLPNMRSAPPFARVLACVETFLPEMLGRPRPAAGWGIDTDVARRSYDAGTVFLTSTVLSVAPEHFDGSLPQAREAVADFCLVLLGFFERPADYAGDNGLTEVMLEKAQHGVNVKEATARMLLKRGPAVVRHHLTLGPMWPLEAEMYLAHAHKFRTKDGQLKRVKGDVGGALHVPEWAVRLANANAKRPSLSGPGMVGIPCALYAGAVFPTITKEDEHKFELLHRLKNPTLPVDHYTAVEVIERNVTVMGGYAHSENAWAAVALAPTFNHAPPPRRKQG